MNNNSNVDRNNVNHPNPYVNKMKVILDPTKIDFSLLNFTFWSRTKNVGQAQNSFGPVEVWGISNLISNPAHSVLRANRENGQCWNVQKC